MFSIVIFLTENLVSACCVLENEATIMPTSEAPYPSGKGAVCKTAMQRFEPARRLQTLPFGKRCPEPVEGQTSYSLPDSLLRHLSLQHRACSMRRDRCSSLLVVLPAYLPGIVFHVLARKLTRTNGDVRIPAVRKLLVRRGFAAVTVTD